MEYNSMESVCLYWCSHHPNLILGCMNHRKNKADLLFSSPHPFPLTPALGNHWFTFGLSGFVYSVFFILIESYNIWPFVTVFSLSCFWGSIMLQQISGLHSFYGWFISHCMDTTSTYLFFSWWTFKLFSLFSCYK